MNYLFGIYVTYTVCAVAVTVWLAHMLFQNGVVFLDDVFSDRPDVGRAVNRLLVTGFFMMNLGYAFFLVKANHAVDGAEAFEVLARKLGALLLSLAVIHFVNVIVFWKLRQRRVQRELPPPIAPQRWVAPPPPPPAAGPAAARVQPPHGQPFPGEPVQGQPVTVPPRPGQPLQGPPAPGRAAPWPA